MGTVKQERCRPNSGKMHKSADETNHVYAKKTVATKMKAIGNERVFRSISTEI